jgi:hypothetical protein
VKRRTMTKKEKETAARETRRMEDEGQWYQPPVQPGERDKYYIYFCLGKAIFYDRTLGDRREADRRVEEMKKRRYSRTVACHDNVWWTHSLIKGAFI